MGCWWGRTLLSTEREGYFAGAATGGFGELDWWGVGGVTCSSRRSERGTLLARLRGASVSWTGGVLVESHAPLDGARGVLCWRGCGGATVSWTGGVLVESHAPLDGARGLLYWG